MSTQFFPGDFGVVRFDKPLPARIRRLNPRKRKKLLHKQLLAAQLPAQRVVRHNCLAVFAKFG